MSKEIQVPGTTGLAVYAVLLNAVGQYWNTSGTPAFEAFNSAHWANYAITTSEQSTTALYLGDMPAVPAGIYSLAAYKRAGGSPALTDTILASGGVDWTGNAINSDGAGVNVTKVNGANTQNVATGIADNPSAAFTLDAGDAQKAFNFSGRWFQIVSTAGGVGAGQYVQIASSNTSTGAQSLVGGVWPLVKPTGTVVYQAQPAGFSPTGSGGGGGGGGGVNMTLVWDAAWAADSVLAGLSVQPSTPPVVGDLKTHTSKAITQASIVVAGVGGAVFDPRKVFFCFVRDVDGTAYETPPNVGDQAVEFPFRPASDALPTATGNATTRPNSTTVVRAILTVPSSFGAGVRLAVKNESGQPVVVTASYKQA